MNIVLFLYWFRSISLLVSLTCLFLFFRVVAATIFVSSMYLNMVDRAIYMPSLWSRKAILGVSMSGPESCIEMNPMHVEGFFSFIVRCFRRRSCRILIGIHSGTRTSDWCHIYLNSALLIWILCPFAHEKGNHFFIFQSSPSTSLSFSLSL